MDAAKGLLDVGAGKPHFTVRGNTIIGKDVVCVGLFEGTPGEGDARGGNGHDFKVCDCHTVSCRRFGGGGDEGIVDGGGGGLWSRQSETSGHP